MEFGVPFVVEYPEFGELFEKLFFKRELDDWYKKKCREKYKLPTDIYRLQTKLPIKEIMVRGRVFPSVLVYIDLLEIKLGNEGAIIPSIQMRISKIIPVYHLIAGYTIQHNDLEAEVDLWGPPQTVDLMETVDQIHSIMQTNGNIALHDRYDLYDKICDWDQIPYSQPLGRTFTVEQAVFNDTLDLC